MTVLEPLEAAGPVIAETVRRHGSTGQNERVRDVVWSHYGCSHALNFGRACSGFGNGANCPPPETSPRELWEPASGTTHD